MQGKTTNAGQAADVVTSGAKSGKESGKESGKKSSAEMPARPESPAEQLPLFAGRPAGAAVWRKTSAKNVSARDVSTAKGSANRHLAAARRLSRSIRRMKRRSSEETAVGLAICAELKAYLGEGPDMEQARQSAQEKTH